MKCPICETEFPPSGTYRPFCSGRCRTIDLGNWLGERYTVPAEEVTQPEPSPDELERAQHGDG